MPVGDLWVAHKGAMKCANTYIYSSQIMPIVVLA